MGFRTARERAGLSPEDVARQLKISRQAVYQWESGKQNPKAKKLPILAALYNCTIDELLRKEP